MQTKLFQKQFVSLHDMPGARLPDNEQDRLQNLYSYELLDTLPEGDYDDITRLASFICGTPVSLVSLVDKDRQWFKSVHGASGILQTPREQAFCAHAILKPDEIMVVPDMEDDERFTDNPLVTGDYHIRFYVGVPLVSEEGFPIGSLCVLDNKPNQLTDMQTEALKTLATQAMRLIQLNKKTRQLTHNRQVMLAVNKELENFAQTTAENIKMPCKNAIEFTEMIEERFADAIDADGKQLLSLIRYSCESIKTTIDTTLARASRISLLQDNKSLFSFGSLMQETKQVVHPDTRIVLRDYPESDTIYFYKKPLLQIVSGIITASSQFNQDEELTFEVGCRQNREQYIFTITDNGKGIPVFSRNGEFVLIRPTGNDHEDSFYTDNLDAIREMIMSLSGSFEMNFDENRGTVFIVNLQK